MTTWITSDLHLSHRMVAILRGFGGPERENADVEAHNAWLAEMWDSTVKEDDIVYILGDIAITQFNSALSWIDERPGRKRLTPGNHDPVTPMHSSMESSLPRWMKSFEIIQPYIRKKVDKKTVLLTHYPYWSWGDGPSRPQARYEQYRLPDLGEFLLHGHTHGPETFHDKSLHVGLDAWNRFINWNEVVDWVRDYSQDH